jgi:hypothetical protein
MSKEFEPLNESEFTALMYDICVRLGFCLSGDEAWKLETHQPGTVVEFTRAVYIAEGMDPDGPDRGIYRQVESAVAAAFERQTSSK